MIDHNLGKSTFTILAHLGFRVLWDDTRMMTWEHLVGFDPTDDTLLDVVLTANDTTVTRSIPFSDFWEDVPTVLAAALSAWNYLVDPIAFMKSE
jgi:hypothetical protein